MYSPRIKQVVASGNSSFMHEWQQESGVRDSGGMYAGQGQLLTINVAPISFSRSIPLHQFHLLLTRVDVHRRTSVMFYNDLFMYLESTI